MRTRISGISALRIFFIAASSITVSAGRISFPFRSRAASSNLASRKCTVRWCFMARSYSLTASVTSKATVSVVLSSSPGIVIVTDSIRFLFIRTTSSASIVFPLTKRISPLRRFRMSSSKMEPISLFFCSL